MTVAGLTVAGLTVVAGLTAARVVTAARRGAHRRGGRPFAGAGPDQTWPAFSSAVQQVSTSRRVTTYGSTLAFGRRSSM